MGMENGEGTGKVFFFPFSIFLQPNGSKGTSIGAAGLMGNVMVMGSLCGLMGEPIAGLG
jgi:hypothetical protein